LERESGGSDIFTQTQIQRQMEALLKEYQQPMMAAGEIIIKGLEEKISISVP